MALLTICLACSTFMIVLLFRELRAPFTKQRGGKVPKQRTEARRLVRPGWNGSHAGVTQASVARSVLVETGGEGAYSPGRGNLKAAKRGERDKSSARSESSESGSERGVGVNYPKDSKTSRSIAVQFCRSEAVPQQFDLCTQ